MGRVPIRGQSAEEALVAEAAEAMAETADR
jgi:hypothetical protein